MCDLSRQAKPNLLLIVFLGFLALVCFVALAKAQDKPKTEQPKAEQKPAVILVDPSQAKDLQIVRLQEENTLHRYNELFLQWRETPQVKALLDTNSELEKKNQDLTKAIYDQAKVTPETYDLRLDTDRGSALVPKPQKQPEPPKK